MDGTRWQQVRSEFQCGDASSAVASSVRGGRSGRARGGRSACGRSACGPSAPGPLGARSSAASERRSSRSSGLRSLHAARGSLHGTTSTQVPRLREPPSRRRASRPSARHAHAPCRAHLQRLRSSEPPSLRRCCATPRSSRRSVRDVRGSARGRGPPLRGEEPRLRARSVRATADCRSSRCGSSLRDIGTRPSRPIPAENGNPQELSNRASDLSPCSTCPGPAAGASIRVDRSRSTSHPRSELIRSSYPQWTRRPPPAPATRGPPPAACTRRLHPPPPPCARRPRRSKMHLQRTPADVIVYRVVRSLRQDTR